MMSETFPRNPITHWNNYTLQDLRQILDHLYALEELGIAQDEELKKSIERDIALRSKKEPPNQSANLPKQASLVLAITA
jgi:hypothetical protein